MADRKVYVNVITRLILRINEGVEVADVIGEMDYSFNPNPDQATLEDTEIVDFEVTESK